MPNKIFTFKPSSYKITSMIFLLLSVIISLFLSNMEYLNKEKIAHRLA